MSKYKNKKIKIDGITFDSKSEGYYYNDVLKLLQAAGEIEILELQPKFILQERFERNYGKKRIIREQSYIADFKIRDKQGRNIVIDVKGVRTEKYRLKRALFLKKYNYIFWEVFYNIKTGELKVKEY